LLAAPVVRRHGAERLLLGHDGECRAATVEYEGKTFPRNDVESKTGADALARYVERFATPGATIDAPLSTMSELTILHTMLVEHPHLMRLSAFCFWGANCGCCAKCLRYYLAQRLFGVDVLSFAANPLANGVNRELDDLVDLSGRTGLLFQSGVLYCMGRLVERGDLRPEEERLREFAQFVYPAIEDKLHGWGRELLSTC